MPLGAAILLVYRHFKKEVTALNEEIESLRSDLDAVRNELHLERNRRRRLEQRSSAQQRAQFNREPAPKKRKAPLQQVDFGVSATNVEEKAIEQIVVKIEPADLAMEEDLMPDMSSETVSELIPEEHEIKKMRLDPSSDDVITGI